MPLSEELSPENTSYLSTLRENTSIRVYNVDGLINEDFINLFPERIQIVIRLIYELGIRLNLLNLPIVSNFKIPMDFLARCIVLRDWDLEETYLDPEQNKILSYRSYPIGMDEDFVEVYYDCNNGETKEISIIGPMKNLAGITGYGLEVSESKKSLMIGNFESGKIINGMKFSAKHRSIKIGQFNDQG